MLTWREYFLLAVLKIVGQGIITGSLFSYIILFSSVGTIMSAVAMFATYIILKKQVSRIGISVMGGTVQLFGTTAYQPDPVLQGSYLCDSSAVPFLCTDKLCHPGNIQ